MIDADTKDITPAESAILLIVAKAKAESWAAAAAGRKFEDMNDVTRAYWMSHALQDVGRSALAALAAKFNKRENGE